MPFDVALNLLWDDETQIIWASVVSFWFGTQAFKLMDDQATDEARRQSAALAYYASEEIKAAAGQRTKAGKVAQRVADGVSISKSSKIGEFSYGFARQKFSGGATTQT